MRGGDQILAVILATIDQKVRGREIRRTRQTFQSGYDTAKTKCEQFHIKPLKTMYNIVENADILPRRRWQNLGQSNHSTVLFASSNEDDFNFAILVSY